MEGVIVNFKSLLKSYKWAFIFWSCQVFYYGTITTIWYNNTPLVKGFTNSDWHKLITIIDFFTSLFLLGIIRFLIKKYISILDLNRENFIKIGLIVLGATLVWHPSHKGTGMLTHYFFGSPKVTYPKLFFQKSNYLILLSDFISVFSWVLTYIGAKLIININGNRIKKLELLVSIKKTQLESLQNQINPHFLFNNLNNIRSLMLENPNKSKEVIHKMSEILVYNLGNNTEKVTSFLKDELQMLNCFIELYKVQLEDRFRFYMDVDTVEFDIEVPSMVVQILVGNAITHGVSNIKKGGVVKLLIGQLNNELYIKVVNSSSLLQKKNSRSTSLLNLEKRLDLIYDGRASFSIECLNNVIVTSVSIPLKKAMIP